MSKKITIIGITDKTPEFTNEQTQLINNCTNFAGGKRHYELVKHYLPENASWKDITVPLNGFIDTVNQSPNNWIVFASGDPLFFGIANTFIREIPNADIEVLSTFNSLQLLGHRLKLNYGLYKPVTLTGRSWTEFDKAMINGEERISLLTDRTKTPSAIAQRMLDAGFNNYKMDVGVCLGGEREQIHTLSIEEAAKQEFKIPNCLFLTQTQPEPIQKGIHESMFETLPGRPNMITKMAIRLTTLAYMNLYNKSVMWDIGACSGSVSIEAKLNYPHLQVIPFEIRPECEQIINNNIRKFKAIGLAPCIGDFVEADKTIIPEPDVVFLGGYGGKMDRILSHANEYLQPGGVIAFNSVSPKSAQTFIGWAIANNFKLKINTSLAVDSYNLIQIIVAEK